MKYALALLFMTGCAGHYHVSDVSGPSEGNHCYTWGDAEGMAQTTCKPSRSECLAAAKETDSRDYYQTLGTCESQ